jgi:toxin-antitoxin system PIN domain toxin
MMAMVLLDVNILVYAHREDSPQHSAMKAWLMSLIEGDEAYGMSDQALSGFLRIVTHPRIFKAPSPLDVALAFVSDVRERPNCVVINPGPRHWGLFTRLITDCDARGNLIPDAWFAALAIEHGCEWISMDRDFARFSGLRWRLPLA